MIAGIVALAAVTFLLKGLVPLTRPLPESFRHRLGGLAPALLAAFIVSEVLGDDGLPVLDAKTAGVAAAVVASALRAPLVVTIVVGAAVAALLRATVSAA